MKQTVLVVDDDPLIRDLVQTLLEDEGYRVCAATTGQQGLQSLHEYQPDLVVLDIDLPDMTGLAVCKKIRSASKVPIIMLSAKDQALDKVVGMEFGADDYVGKPCNPKELVARVKAQLRRWSQWQAPSLHSGKLEARQATVLFALLGDDQAFEGNSLEDLTRQVIEFQEIFEQVVSSHGGSLNSYSEDTAVAIFAEGKAERSAADACRAAQVLRHGFATLQQEWVRQQLRPLTLSCGLHSGELLLGDVSLSGEQKPALVGDEARKAATLARLTQKLGAPLLASQFTVILAGQDFAWSERGQFSLREGDSPVGLFGEKA